MSDKKRILIVEDDADFLRLVKSFLDILGFEVCAAEDALQAVCQARRLSPSLIILDYMLPGGDGKAVLDKLRSLPETRDTPVLFFSALDLAGRFVQSVLPRTYFLKKCDGMAALAALILSILFPGRAGAL